MGDIKAVLFARWLTTCYDTSIINTQNGEWWNRQLDEFNIIVYPNYINNGTVDNFKTFMNKKSDINIIKNKTK